MGQRIIKIDSHFNPVTLGEFYNSPSDDCRLVVLTSRDVTVLRKALLPLYWSTRFGEYVAPNYFRTSDSVDLRELLEELEVKLMGCGIAESLDNIAQAITLLAKSQCCEQGDIIVNVNGGVNGSLSDGSVTYGESPYSDAPETLPDGYESEEQYETQKCAMANQMVSDIVYTLSVLSGASGVSALGGLIVAVLGVTAILAVPQVAIPTLIAAVAIAFLASGTLYAVSVEVESKRQEIVCALISGNNLDVIMESLADIIDTIIANVGASSPVGAAIKTVLLVFFNSETLNKLYASYAGFMYPEGDCGDCGGCGEPGEVQHLPAYSSVGDGSFSFVGQLLEINGETYVDEIGYRYSVWFGGSWGSPPYFTRKLLEIVSINQSLGGEPETGYITIQDESGNYLFGGGFGTADIGGINDSLAISPECVSAVAFTYSPGPTTLVLRFSD